MKKGIILYQSKYGATKKYAGWLAEETGFACTETPRAAIKDAQQYDTVIFCGGIYASGIAGLSFLRKHIAKLSNKKVAILCVGASPYDEASFNEIKSRNVKNELQGIPVFYARGAWDEENMTLKDRTLCRLLQKAVAKKPPDTYEPWMQALMSALGQKCDWTDKEYLKPLLDYIK